MAAPIAVKENKSAGMESKGMQFAKLQLEKFGWKEGKLFVELFRHFCVCNVPLFICSQFCINLYNVTVKNEPMLVLQAMDWDLSTA